MTHFKRRLVVIALVGLFIVVPSFGKAATIEELQAQINALLQQLQVLQQQLAQQGGGDEQKWCHTFNTNLKIGDQNDEVTNLVRALVKEGLLNSDEMFQDGRTVLNFDERVASAVSAFQEKYRDEILTPNGL